MNKAWIVAKHEFLVTIRRVWFVISTFVFPLIFLGIGGIMLLITRETVEAAAAKRTAKPLGLVDLWGELRKDRSPKGLRLTTFRTEEEAAEAVKKERIASYIIVPRDYLETGQIVLKTVHKPSLMTADQSQAPPGLESWLIESVLSRKVDDRRIARVKAPLQLRPVYLEKDGTVSGEDFEGSVKRSVMAYAFFFLLMMSIFTASGYLLQGMADEKENRVMEIVLSSLTPDQLMFGKLIGLGAAGLLQLGIWLTMGVVGVLLFAIQIILDPVTVLYCVVFFLLGYVLFGSLMLGFGALGTNFRESQQMASLWGFIGFSPLFAQMALVESPHGTVAKVFSYIPLTAPATMVLRYTIDPKGMPGYEIPLVIGIMILSTALALRLSAKLYRVGLLLYGKRPSLREIWRWMWA